MKKTMLILVIGLTVMSTVLTSCAIGPIQALTARRESHRILPMKADVALDSAEVQLNNSPDTGAVRAKAVAEFSLDQNAPNPFNSSTTITYTIPKTSEVRAAVYDMLGRKVKSFGATVHAPGTYSLQWDGSDGVDREVATGVYVFVISADKKSLSKKVVLLK